MSQQETGETQMKFKNGMSNIIDRDMRPHTQTLFLLALLYRNSQRNQHSPTTQGVFALVSGN